MRIGKLALSKRFLALGLGIGLPVVAVGAFVVPGVANAAPSNTMVSGILFTFYGAFDNSPPGFAITHPGCGGGGHAHAGGIGTFANPATVASPSGGVGGLGSFCQKIYVPDIQMYFIHEDQCNPCGGQNSNHEDLWLSGNTLQDNRNAVLSCENDWTHTASMIVGAGAGQKVDSSPLFGGSCAASHGSISQPNPGSSAGGASGSGSSFSGGGGGSGSGSGS
jgi:hypothetical protein